MSRDRLSRLGGTAFFGLYAGYLCFQLAVQLERYGGHLIGYRRVYVANSVCVILVFLLMAVSYLVRRPARAKAEGFVERYFPFLCAALPVLINETSGYYRMPVFLPATGAATVLLFAGNTLSIWGQVSLRRSFSIMAEARDAVFHGPYRFVRHPLYVAQILSAAALWLLNPNWIGLPLLAVFIAGQHVRAVREEAKLAAALPEYGAYRARTGAYFPVKRDR